MSIYYDRRISPGLVAALKPGGFAESLAQYAVSGQFSMDLQLLGRPKDPVSSVSLYVGTTYVLKLRYWAGTESVRLSASDTWATAKNGWRSSWEASRSVQSVAGSWHEVEAYLERVIPRVTARHLKEGRVQAAIARYPHPDLVIIDREAVMGFKDEANGGKTLRSRLLKPLLASVEGSEHPWWKPKLPGNECDAVAISRDGEILAIEVKPERVDIAWAPLQAHHYADLLQTWADQTPNAAEILVGMYQQRADIGLVKASWPVRITNPILVRPVVAVTAGASTEYQKRIRLVYERIRDAGLDSPSMRFRAVSLVGRLDEWRLDEPLPD